MSGGIGINIENISLNFSFKAMNSLILIYRIS